ncbi:hypothetical protein B0H34DRAFT_840472 [Crassisporium funariophilum]|nr:hypothetical protein B0H34DRAFT_840472 [Crassisporium funariophilum]
MPFKRPSAALRSSSSSTSSSTSGSRSHKRRRSNSSCASDSSNNRPLQVYIVQEKLDEGTARELVGLLESYAQGHHSLASSQALHLEQCSNVQDSDIIITSIRMRKRLERHVDWSIAKQKAIVTPDWLRDSVKQNHPTACGDYAALEELHDETVKNCPEDDCGSSETVNASPKSSAKGLNIPPTYKVPIVKPTSARVFKNWASKYACTRASPLVCINQALAVELGVLCRSRELEGLNVNALSYERVCGMIKSYPNLITRETFERDIIKLPGFGSKMLWKIEEFLDNGYIEECRTMSASERYQSLSLFATIYGIGPANARKLYDLGLRTVEDLERYYDVPPGTDISSLEAELVTPNGRKIESKDKLPDMSIKVALALRLDLEISIPRDEVEEMHAIVMAEMEVIQPGCVSTIVGGYRRGKPQSNDVDIVISHSDLRSGADLVKGLCARFTKHLVAKGLVTHVMHLSGFHAHNALRTEHWDSLEKALTVFVLPRNSNRKRVYRRLDLIFAAPESYWTAVIGWSGSKMFQRDLRLWAKAEKGLKFDSSGLTRRHDSKLFVPRSEQEVFDILGLDWIDPTMRNADV